MAAVRARLLCVPRGPSAEAGEATVGLGVCRACRPTRGRPGGLGSVEFAVLLVSVVVTVTPPETQSPRSLYGAAQVRIATEGRCRLRMMVSRAHCRRPSPWAGRHPDRLPSLPGR
jgi:hypothetical protein